MYRFIVEDSFISIIKHRIVKKCIQGQKKNHPVFLLTLETLTFTAYFTIEILEQSLLKVKVTLVK